MARDSFKFSGERELKAALAEIGKAARRTGSGALRKAGKPILERYQGGTTVKSGHLVESETMGTRLNKRQRRLTPKPRSTEVEIHIGATDPAGIQEEFGIRQRANPALTEAWDSEGGQAAVDRIGDELWSGIDRTARRVKKG